MTKRISLILTCISVVTWTATAQPGTPIPGTGSRPSPPQLVAADASAKPELTRFNLDFPGGKPRELVAAIQKAMGKPLNAIVPEEYADVVLPPLKMNNVTVPQLFKALEAASVKTVAYITGTAFAGGYGGGRGGPSNIQVSNTIYGFRTAGAETDDSIWYFRVDKPAGPPLVASKACRFYSLAPYLDLNLTVDDITTAIQTGWKMMGDKETPTISFHKDTQLLIAVGEPGKLETIDAVLDALRGTRPPGSGGGRRGRSAAAPEGPNTPSNPGE